MAQPATILVDIGNHSLKAARLAAGASAFDEADVIRFDNLQSLAASRWLADDHTHLQWLVVSVQRPAEERLASWVASTRAQDHYQRLAATDFDMALGIEFPDKVGPDRVAAAAAANLLRAADRAAIVIDAGTAITVDLVTPSGCFAGGAIFCGMQLSIDALANGTDALPREIIDAGHEPPAPAGRNTWDAMRAGVYWGAIGAIRELVHRLQQQLPVPADLFITGGDGAELARELRLPVQFRPHLVLEGMCLPRAAREARR